MSHDRRRIAWAAPVRGATCVIIKIVSRILIIMADFAVLNGDQLECLASPVRRDVFLAVRMLGKASATDVAESTSLSVETVHFHLRALTQAKLLEPCGKRATARRPESIYTSTAKTFKLPDIAANPQLAEIVRRSVSAGLRRTIRGYESAATEAAENANVHEGFQVIQTQFRLNPEDAKEFFELVERASKFARERESADGNMLHWTSVVYPTLS